MKHLILQPHSSYFYIVDEVYVCFIMCVCFVYGCLSVDGVRKYVHMWVETKGQCQMSYSIYFFQKLTDWLK